MCKSFFRRNSLCIARKNEALQRKKDRCLDVLTVFRYALILFLIDFCCICMYNTEELNERYVHQ